MKVNDHHEILREKFGQGAKEYDQQRKHIIPCLDDLYHILADLTRTNIQQPRILDLGAGTGLLTSYIYDRHPQGHFTLLDISEEMLNIARDRFKNSHDFTYVVADYTHHEFRESFDLIVSSLSIHHLKNQDKQILYQKIYDLLNPGGVFLNADQVLGPTPATEEEYQRNWMQKLDVGSLSEFDKNIILDRMQLDKPATLNENLTWLKNIGFIDVDIYYKYYNFCILHGKK
ncbi:MAG TPA: class I SAM-dependent methyltransferase [Methanobacteriaceae archaeon]|nr:class I SAM-dependent methyltransferase [Methanobacteriaceae archaeon]